VIGILLKAFLSVGQLPQMAFGRLRVDLLKRLTTDRVPLAAALNVAARKRFAVRVGREIVRR